MSRVSLDASLRQLAFVAVRPEDAAAATDAHFDQNASKLTSGNSMNFFTIETRPIPRETDAEIENLAESPPSIHGPLILHLPKIRREKIHSKTENRGENAAIFAESAMEPALIIATGTSILQVRDSSGRLVIIWRDLRRFILGKSNIAVKISALSAVPMNETAWLISCGMADGHILVMRLQPDADAGGREWELELAGRYRHPDGLPVTSLDWYWDHADTANSNMKLMLAVTYASLANQTLGTDAKEMLLQLFHFSGAAMNQSNDNVDDTLHSLMDSLSFRGVSLPATPQGYNAEVHGQRGLFYYTCTRWLHLQDQHDNNQSSRYLFCGSSLGTLDCYRITLEPRANMTLLMRIQAHAQSVMSISLLNIQREPLQQSDKTQHLFYLGSTGEDQLVCVFPITFDQSGSMHVQTTAIYQHHFTDLIPDTVHLFSKEGDRLNVLVGGYSGNPNAGGQFRLLSVNV